MMLKLISIMMSKLKTMILSLERMGEKKEEKPNLRKNKLLKIWTCSKNCYRMVYVWKNRMSKINKNQITSMTTVFNK